MRALGRVQDRLRPAPSHPVSADDVDGGLPNSAAVDSDHTSGFHGLQCPPALGRCARHLARRLRGDRSDTTGVAGHQPSGTSGDDVTDECWCCCLADCMCGGMRRLVTTLTDKNSTESKCQSPGCKWWKSGCTRVYLISVNLASFIGGWLLIVFAVWIHINGETFFFWSLLRDNPTGPFIVIDQIPIIFAIVGLLFAITSFLGCCGACADSVCFLGFYTVFLIMVIVAEITVGILTTALSQQISESLRDSMSYQIQQEYNNTARQVNQTAPNTLKLTRSWDMLQSKFNCCGVDGPQDYMDSAWYNHTKDLAGTFVPPSCCIPVRRRSHYAINENFCQVHALLWPQSLNDSMYLNTRGCHDSLVTWSDSYLQRVIGLPLSLVILTQIVSLVLACALVKWVRRKQSDYWWYVTEDCE